MSRWTDYRNMPDGWGKVGAVAGNAWTDSKGVGSEILKGLGADRLIDSAGDLWSKLRLG